MKELDEFKKALDKMPDLGDIIMLNAVMVFIIVVGFILSLMFFS